MKKKLRIAMLFGVLLLFSLALSAISFAGTFPTATYYYPDSYDSNVAYKYSNNYHYYNDYQSQDYRQGYAQGYDDGYYYRTAVHYSGSELNRYASDDPPRYTKYVRIPAAGSTQPTTYYAIGGRANTAYPSYTYTSSVNRYIPGYRVRTY